MAKRVIISANMAWNLWNFRLPLARALRARGLEPVFVSPYDEYAARLEREGFRWVEWKMSRGSMNPFAELAALLRLIGIYRSERPACAHHFTVKCVLYGSLAARAADVPAVINAVTGLGHVFISQSLSARVLRPVVRALYRFVLGSPGVRVIFQNSDDLNAFREFKLVSEGNYSLIRSSGVDLERFKAVPEPPDAVPTVLFASRLIAEKGVRELIEAARLLRERGAKARFVVAGAADAGNPSSIPEDTLASWRAEKLAEFPGRVDSVESLIAGSAVVVLPSYREGVPRILLEAAAMGRPCVTTDVPGCREAVEDGVNGLLVPAKDAPALARALETLLSDRELRARYGGAGRAKVEREFGERAVIGKTLEVYAGLSM
jgi:glycosyltransferase involved in cell wall biosynthesis